MALLLLRPPPPPYLRFMALRFLSHSSLHPHFPSSSSSSFSSSSLARPSLLFNPQPSSGSNAYGSDQIQVLEGLDPVRKRPGMYIGSTGRRGLHQLVYEILDNAVDEAQAGFASKIEVVLLADGSVSIADNGRGIPTDMHPATKKSALETVLMLMITLRQEDTDPEKNHHNEYFYAGGLVEYVRWLNTDNKPLHDVVGFRKEMDGITVDVAFQWCSDAYSDTMLGYANSIRTIDGTKASLT
ncbi:hypothetical protein L3X38_037316 [Prunus dulcis]|uniref:DNA topoisomerase (ATP-hydrolyzing) n=1 Tax=Prunus dulcis TaxID=3755 RepID=A0AAD4V354_PRUDU|nr:hypothetical protein L3X38_037316 [Prunus dulcis]